MGESQFEEIPHDSITTNTLHPSYNERVDA
jgi:hypothetical protein